MVGLLVKLKEGILLGSLVTQHGQSSVQQLSVVFDVAVKHKVSANEDDGRQRVAVDTVPRSGIDFPHHQHLHSSGEEPQGGAEDDTGGGRHGVWMGRKIIGVDLIGCRKFLAPNAGKNTERENREMERDGERLER